MKRQAIFIGKTELKQNDSKVKGEYLTIDDEWFYRISNFDHMDPFFMSVVSDADHWLYIWSNGALTAGRRNADHALFPYYTDDKIRDAADFTGSKTILRIAFKDKTLLWEPFSDRYAGAYKIERNLYKNVYGDKLIFEEINRDLNLAFRYVWMNSDRFGFIKKSTIINLNDDPVKINALDGIQNILPSGVQQAFQNEFSTLVDAYKKNELETDCGLGLFSLSSIPVDRAEPSESLRATTVWSAGVQAEQVLLSSRQLDIFRKGGPVRTEEDIRAARGAYLINAIINLPVDEQQSWYIIADVDKDSAQVASLKKQLQTNANLIEEIESDIAKGTENLLRIVARADGLQKTADRLTTSRHFSNVLFNVMRGGIFEDGYNIDKSDFLNFLANADKINFETFVKLLEPANDRIEYRELLRIAEVSGNTDFERLCYEYLPLSFSRRHGDPSRPWNQFSIDIRDEKGNKKLHYQGNWRDIFQNWEALAVSYPEYLEAMITRFVNASTADGYNPYRLTRDGIDWEVMDPNDPWSYIGYWGDHQIIYLTKLLELSHQFHPRRLTAFLNKAMFTYANVPYRIKAYDDIVKNPHDTVDFDVELEHRIKKRCRDEGERAKYIHNACGNLYHVNLMEKLLAPVLAKIANFVPEAGIWLNTQRPEWNDANNALVGNGVSMVTLYYLRRHIKFILNLVQDSENTKITISGEIDKWFNTTVTALDRFRDRLEGRFSDGERKALTDALGRAGSEYRQQLYSAGFADDKKSVQAEELISFFKLLLQYIDHSIRANRRDDHLYHAYNLISISDNAIRIRYLYEMLEGQVAVLSSGLISAEETVDLLDALRHSKLYREDQSTYLLYPDRRLPRFTEKNQIPEESYGRSQLLQKLVKHRNTDIVVLDDNGGIHFNGDFRNAAILRNELKKLDQQYQSLVEKESDLIADIYEKMFDHQSFTGRSGTFFKYEGLGSTYWHMVSKLALAVQECYFRAVEDGADEKHIQQIKQHYFEIKAGIGVHKSPDLYGGFPTDPYSHTPGHAGVQQPGMTGQVKEDIMSRWGELGVKIENGQIRIAPRLLPKSEFLKHKQSFIYYDSGAQKKQLKTEPGTLVFTLAQVPFIYSLSDREELIVTFVDGKTKAYSGLILDAEISGAIFERRGSVKKIQVFIDEARF